MIATTKFLNMKKIISILFILFLFIPAKSETCKIYGNAGTYAGETLRLYSFSDYITLTKKLIAESKVDDEGYFSFTIETNETFEAFIDLDVFIGYIIIEPGKNFEIVLPKKTIRRHEDIMNPYFKPVEFYVRILNEENTVTAEMKKFDALNKAVIEKFLKNRKHINPGSFEIEIKKLDDSTYYSKNSFFTEYKKYKLLDLRVQAVYKNKKAVIRKNFSNEPVLYNNPAYNKLLKERLGNVLFELYGDTLFKLLATNSGWNMMSRTLSNYDLCYNQEFRNYFLFINLYNEFYRTPILKNNIIDVLYSAKNYIKNENTLKAVNNFLNNSSNLIAGNTVLDFRLPDNETYMHGLSDFRGKFIYLGFFSTESYSCKKDILLIKSLAEKNSKMLKVILVFKENNTSQIKKFLKNTDLKNVTILHSDDGGKVIEDYNVRAFPTYYLINPEGRLSLISAPGPSENFESVYFNIRQKWRIKQMQKNK